MKIVVDEMPGYADYCLFSTFNGYEGCFDCKFKEGVCMLEKGRECPYLIPFWEAEIERERLKG